jgi:hypothetical protein
MAEKKKKTCFVISPIGNNKSDVRIRADKVLKYIIAPCMEVLGYDYPLRADKISEPGVITSQVIEHILNDDLIIADLTGHNANVFYELAIRHASRKPVVQIIDINDDIPFDVSSNRIIQFSHIDLESVDSCKTEIINQVRAIEENPSLSSNPISQTIDLQPLRQSDDPVVKSNLTIIKMINGLQNELSSVKSVLSGFANVPLQLTPISSFYTAAGIPVSVGSHVHASGLHPAYYPVTGRATIAAMPPIEGMLQPENEEDKPHFMKD